MKSINLKIVFDSEKLAVLKRYMGKKQVSLDCELADALQKLYEKYVPAPVREYIDESEMAKAKRMAKSTEEMVVSEHEQP